MKRLLVCLGATLIATGAVLAAGTHSGGHGHEKSDDHHEMMAVGVPGKASDVKREIEIIMKETDDGDMVFEPSRITVSADETIRFVVRNKGELAHEFVLDDHHGVAEHKALMQKFPEMEHDDPNSVRLEPGDEGEVIWKFANTGEFEFACLIPGHYDAGMKGSLTVAK